MSSLLGSLRHVIRLTDPEALSLRQRTASVSMFHLRHSVVSTEEETAYASAIRGLGEACLKSRSGIALHVFALFQLMGLAVLTGWQCHQM